MIGPINLDEKLSGKRSAGNPHAAFEVAGVGNVSQGSRIEDRSENCGEYTEPYRKARQFSTLPWLAVIFRQLCWAHLKRDFTKIAERKGQSGKIGKNLLAAVKKMFRYWHKVRDGTLSRQKFQELMDPLRKQVETLLSEGASCGNSKTEGTCKQLLKVKQALWTFVDKIGIEPTNNLAA
jgi:transposase